MGDRDGEDNTLVLPSGVHSGTHTQTGYTQAILESGYRTLMEISFLSISLHSIHFYVKSKVGTAKC